MTTTNITILVGVLLGLGLVFLLRALIPAQPDLHAALTRQTTPELARATTVYPTHGLAGAIGVRVYPYLAHTSWLKIPYKDLSLIKMSVPQYMGDKVGSMVVALLFPPLLNILLILPGSQMNWGVPITASIAFAAGAFFLTDVQVRSKAARARDNFAHQLGAFSEMVALVIANGSGTTDALHRASRQGDSWVFLRLQEEMQKAETARRAPWDALKILAEEVDTTDLADLADHLVLTKHGTSVSETIRETAKGLRHKNLSREQSEATSVTKRLRLPLGVLVLVFIMIIIYPAGSAMLGA